MPSYVSPNRLTTRFDVEFKPDLVRVGEGARDALLMMNADAHVYAFDAQRVSGLGLEQGAVVLIDHLDLFRVVSTRTEGGQLIVEGEPAALEDAIENGTIEFDYLLDLSFDTIRQALENSEAMVIDDSSSGLTAGSQSGLVPAGSHAVRYNPTDGTVSFSFTATGGVEYEMKLKPSPTKTEVLMNLTRKTGRGSVRFSFIGELKTPRSRFSTTIVNGMQTASSYETQGLDGKMRFEVFGGGTGNDVWKVEMPFPVFEAALGTDPGGQS